MLGALLLQIGEVASVDALIDSVWGDPAPASARHMVHEYVSRLRVTLGDAPVIATRPPGYTIERDACELDAARFAELLRAAHSAAAAGEFGEALDAFDRALGLWRGDVLADVALEAGARSAAGRLDNERRAARSDRFDLALALGRHSELVPELERAVAAEPLDEQLLRQLMTALYRNGRQADALARYRDGRHRLVDELGIEPGADLRSLEQAILRHDPDLAAPPSCARLRPPEPTVSRPNRRRLRWGVALVALASVLAAVLAVTLWQGHGGTAAAPLRRRCRRRSRRSERPTRRLGAARYSRQRRSPPAPARSGSRFPMTSSVARISPAFRRITASIPLERPAASLAAAER